MMNDVMLIFPEILKYKPTRTYRNGTYWWSPESVAGRENRIKLLKKVIVQIKFQKNV